MADRRHPGAAAVGEIRGRHDRRRLAAMDGRADRTEQPDHRQGDHPTDAGGPGTADREGAQHRRAVCRQRGQRQDKDCHEERRQLQDHLRTGQ